MVERRLRTKNITVPSKTYLLLSYLISVFVTCLGASIWTALCVGTIGGLLDVGDVILHAAGFYAPENMEMDILSYVIGLPLGFASFWFVLVRPGMLLSKPLKTFSLDDEIWNEGGFEKSA